ncbi:MAG: hypothetical protein AB1Z98_38605 [Nannocystaceae bacterium]
MKSCPGCQRHVRPSESTCPFCAAALRETGAPLLAILGLASMMIGCSDDGLESGEGGGSGSTTVASSTGSPGNTVTSGESETTGSFETTAVDSDDTAVDSGGGAGFIYGAPDGGDAGFDCDLVANDCPKGEKCSPWANDGGDEWNATRCVPVADAPVGPGEACATEGSPVSGFDDCEIGSVCVDVDPGTLEGVCEAMCAGMLNSCPDVGDVCILTSPALVPLCYLECDPLMPECPRAEICDELSDFGICV